MVETRVRSGVKSTIWRVCGVVILATITYAYTRQWITTGLITVIHHGVFLFVFYFHERLWLRVKGIQHPVYRSLSKMFTYETLCGNVILGTITYLVTGDWRQMTAITLTYIGIKHVCYIFNEFVWGKIKIGAMVLVFLLIQGNIGHADYWASNVLKASNFNLSTEIRMDSDVYLRFIQADWCYTLSTPITIILSGREIQTNKREHSPMVSLVYRRGWFKNRMRIQYRINDGEDITRFRNKVTISRNRYFVAWETFIEKDDWRRNRYYMGVDIHKSFGVFFMRQVTNAVAIWVFGTAFIVRVL